MKKSYLASLILLPILLVSCGNKNTLDGYDNTDVNKLNTSLFYRNDGKVTAADPQVIQYNGKYYMYATNANNNGDCSYLQCWSSVNLTDWTNEGYCYQPERDHWALDGFWAPEVIEHNDKFYLYYSGWNLKAAIHEMGVAVSSSPVGPFIDYVGYNDNGEYVSPKDSQIHFDFDGGANDAVIDGSPFIDDDGKAYLYFSHDQHRDATTGATISSICMAELNSDMVSVKPGTAQKLFSPSLDWEKESGTGAMWNEAPFMYKKDGVYYLLYSANYYQDRAYCLGVATSLSPTGPFVKAEEPILKTKDYWDYVTGTGHCSVFSSSDGNETFLAYHSHKDTVVGGAVRKIVFDRIFFNEGKVHVNGPSISPQLLPSGTNEYGNLSKLSSITVNGARTTKLSDGIINPFRDDLDNELELSTKEATIMVDFDRNIKTRAIMIYDSACFDYALSSIDSITFKEGKAVYGLKMNKEYFENVDSFVKIPCSAFIYEFDELETNHIEIKVSNKSNIALNEIVVVGK